MPDCWCLAVWILWVVGIGIVSIERDDADQRDFDLVWKRIDSGDTQRAHGRFTCVFARRDSHERQEDPPPDGQVRSDMSNPQGESLPPDGKGYEDEHNRAEPR